MGRKRWEIALLTLAAAVWTVNQRVLVTAATSGGITAMSVCGGGATSSESCPAGTFDTQEKVIAPNGTPLNDSGNLPNAVDEHSSVFKPYSLGGNPDYLFFVASGTAPHDARSSALVHNPVDIGVVVLSGGAGPNKKGQWTMTFASGYGSPYADGHIGQVLIAPNGQGNCPSAPDAKDTTWDLNYAAPGSVVADPLGPPGSLLMFFEGTNECAQSVGGAHIALGIATSHNYGVDWPTYAPTSSFAFAPLPYQNVLQGPNIPAGAGAFGNAVCVGNLLTAQSDCSYTKPYPGYGRYPVLATPPGPDGRASQPAAFVDRARTYAPIYLYSVQNYNPPTALPDGRFSDLTIARAPLVGGSGPLVFETWNGAACPSGGPSCWVGPASGQSENDQPEFQILKDGDFTHCEDTSQARSSPGLSYVAATQQYLLTFVCRSLGDPTLGMNQTSPEKGAAWFFSTSYDLSDPNQWTTPKEILGTWNVFDMSSGPSDNSKFYNGWYPSFMSPGQDPGWLGPHGYAFYLWGCEGGGCGGRHFTSRRFFVQTTDNVYSQPPVTTITGLTSTTSHIGTASFKFRSNEPGSAFQCAFDSGVFTPCNSGTQYALQHGVNAFRVQAINPFGMVGPVAIAHVVY